MTTLDHGRHLADQELSLPGLVDLAAGYQRAQVLFTANELGIFGLLSDGPRTVDEVATVLGAEPRGVEALLDACAALRILRASDKGYENSRTARLFLLPGGELSFAPALHLWARLSYGAWGRLAHAVRDNEPQTAAGPRPLDLFDRLGENAEDFRAFFDGLSALAYWPAHKLAQLVDFSERRHLLDVGGGSGAFAAVIARLHPSLRVTLFDRAAVCALARERFSRMSVSDRVSVVAGDFHRDALPEGSDCALLSNVLHDWSPDECRALLRRVHDALTPGGEVIVCDFMPVRTVESAAASLFSLELVLDTQRGKVYTLDEIREWLEESGFGRASHVALTADISVLTALKKA